MFSFVDYQPSDWLSVERFAEKCVDEDHVDVSVQWIFNHLLLLLLILLKIFHKIATDKVNDI